MIWFRDGGCLCFLSATYELTGPKNDSIPLSWSKYLGLKLHYELLYR